MAGVMSETTKVDDREAVELLRRHVAALDRLEELSNRQRDLIERGDTRGLLALLARRQEVTDELTGLAKKLEGVRREWPALRARLSADESAAAQKLVDEVGVRMKRLIAADAEDARMLDIRKQQSRQGVSSMVAAQGALSAYGGSAAASAPPLNRVEVNDA